MSRQFTELFSNRQHKNEFLLTNKLPNYLPLYGSRDVDGVVNDMLLRRLLYCPMSFTISVFRIVL